MNEIKDELGISESTIRRDLNTLDEEGKLVKVLVVLYQLIMNFQEKSRLCRRKRC